MDIIKNVQEKMSQNTYIVVNGGDAILIDAGVHVGKIEENLKMFSPKPTIRAILLTHCHFDHVCELDNIIAKYSCPAYIFKSGKPMLYKEDQNMSIMDNPFKVKTKRNIKTFLDSQVLNFGSIEVKCVNTPGHSIDSSCFIIEDNMFTGDTIFRVEVGRNDLYSGDENMQRISLERILNTLSKDVEHFYAGHGPNFTYEELKYNVNRILGEG